MSKDTLPTVSVKLAVGVPGGGGLGGATEEELRTDELEALTEELDLDEEDEPDLTEEDEPDLVDEEETPSLSSSVSEELLKSVPGLPAAVAELDDSSPPSSGEDELSGSCVGAEEEGESKPPTGGSTGSDGTSLLLLQVIRKNATVATAGRTLRFKIRFINTSPW